LAAASLFLLLLVSFVWVASSSILDVVKHALHILDSTLLSMPVLHLGKLIHRPILERDTGADLHFTWCSRMRLDPPANMVSQLSHWTFLQLPPETGACAVTPLFHTADFGVLNPPDNDMPTTSGANCTAQHMLYRTFSQFQLVDLDSLCVSTG
jgi:hypothetical protein